MLTKEQHESYKNAKICHVCKEKFEHKYAKDKNIVKLVTNDIRQVNIEVLHITYIMFLIFSVSKEIHFFTMDLT